MYNLSLNTFNIRDGCLLFLVLQAFMVLIMHELDYRKNLLKTFTVIPYRSAALVIFEVLLYILKYMHFFWQKSRKIVQFKSYIDALKMLDMQDDRL